MRVTGIAFAPEMECRSRYRATCTGLIANTTSPAASSACTHGLPVTQLWYTDGSIYLGTVVIRRKLTRELARVGGHIGYHVVPS